MESSFPKNDKLRSERKRPVTMINTAMNFGQTTISARKVVGKGPFKRVEKWIGRTHNSDLISRVKVKEGRFGITLTVNSEENIEEAKKIESFIIRGAFKAALRGIPQDHLQEFKVNSTTLSTDAIKDLFEPVQERSL